MSNSLLRSISHNSFADSILLDITNRTTRYYHYFGKVAPWSSDSNPLPAIDSNSYEHSVRNEMVMMKEISPADVSFVIPRNNWVTGFAYDQYDDSYSTEIHGIDLQSSGAGYTVPIVTIGTVLPSNTTVSLNDQYYYVIGGIGYVYTVTTAGTTGDNGSVGNTIGAAYASGTAILTCVGNQATATAQLGTLTYIDKIVSVTMTYNGSGYITPPTVTITDSTGGGAVSVSVMVRGSLLGFPLVKSYALEDSRYYVYNSSTNAVYICIYNNEGGLSTVAPTGTSPTILNTADGYKWKYIYSLDTVNKFITSKYLPIITASKNSYTPVGSIVGVSIDSGGSGYSGNTVNISGDGTSAIITPTITDGVITGALITNPGSGYTYANLSLSAGGSGAALTPWLFNGTIALNAQFESESQAVIGNLLGISVISGGYGYSSATAIIIGNGTGATATVTVSGGRVTKLTITNRGTGYNWANIVISGDGYGATARPVLSPYGGLGKDPVNQFASKSLMFYSDLSYNLNQGLSLANDYRQIGIIKDPVRYSDKKTLKSNFATCCWKIDSVSTISGVALDDIVTTYSNSVLYSFRVVYVSGSSILLIPIDNGIPTSGMQFTRPVTSGTAPTFTASAVVPPSVDKYSGDVVTIDNEVSFNAYSAVIRTIVNF